MQIQSRNNPDFQPTLEQKIGQLINIGFHGTSPSDASLKKIQHYSESGLLGGLTLFKYNIINREQLTDLIEALKGYASPLPLFICLDQEGGKVQRVSSANGFRDTPSAKKIASASSDEALACYDQLGELLKETGINFDFAPCVDLEGTSEQPSCPVIGGIERSYSSEPEKVAKYADTMIQSLHSHDVLSCIKHFPGHGRVASDSHEGLPDISQTWSEEDLLPFKLLIEDSSVDAVMTAHLLHKGIDQDFPATFSKKWISKLRNELSYDGVIISDCLHMGAILQQFTIKEVVIAAFSAGVDILLFSNNPLASAKQGIRHASSEMQNYVTVNQWQVPDMELPEKIITIVKDAIQSGELSEATIDASYKRVLALKNKLT